MGLTYEKFIKTTAIDYNLSYEIVMKIYLKNIFDLKTFYECLEQIIRENRRN